MGKMETDKTDIWLSMTIPENWKPDDKIKILHEGVEYMIYIEGNLRKPGDVYPFNLKDSIEKKLDWNLENKKKQIAKNKKALFDKGYIFDIKEYIKLIIKHDIFDKMQPEKDSMIVRYNDEWNLPEVKFENPGKYRTGKRKFTYNFMFPTSFQKKEAYKRELILNVGKGFFANSIKVNYINQTGNVIEEDADIYLTHPVYLVPISIKNPYTDGIDVFETVRLYLRGKVYKDNHTNTDDTNNFEILDNNTMGNIVMIGIKDTVLKKFSIKDIKKNIISFDSKSENLGSLFDIFKILKQINHTMELSPGPLEFFKHEQFYIKDNICKRIFYEKDIDNTVDNIVMWDEVYVFVYNTTLVSNRDIRLNKEYGTIYANLEKELSCGSIPYDEVKTPNGVKKIKEKLKECANQKKYIIKINFGKKGSDIYIMTVSKLEDIITKNRADAMDIS